MQAVAVIQEQHGERTRLLNQWKQLKMELLFDPLNRLDVAAVPITLLVDEIGVIRFRNPNEQQLRTFLTSARLEANPNRSNLPDGAALQAGDRLAMNGKLDEAIDWYSERLANRKEQARLHFRLGVVHRMRFDKHPESHPDDFRTAIQHWKKALQLNPNQYIWRRRIQQYGPILDKPYPFYNWVDQARREVLARGDNPLKLRVEPAGAELIGPGQRIATAQSDKTKNPDPKGKITRVAEGLLNVRSIVVPSTNKKQKAARVHVAIEPIRESGFGWNNEGGPTTLWIESPQEGSVSQHHISLRPDSKSETSYEARRAEFEMRGGATSVTGFFLVHLCDKKSGVCTYRRKDFRIVVESQP